MRYFELNENNEIIGAYPTEYKDMPKDVVQVNEQIWKQRLNDYSLNCYEDGKLIKKDFRTPKETEDLRIENINSYTQSFIYLKYPQPKQSSANLGVYDEDYKNEMISFISNCIALSNEAIDNGTSFEDYKAMLDGDE